MISLFLNPDEAVFLQQQLTRQLQTLESELVHTDAHTMQHELAMDLDRLRSIVSRLQRSSEEPNSAAARPL